MIHCLNSNWHHPKKNCCSCKRGKKKWETNCRATKRINNQFLANIQVRTKLSSDNIKYYGIRVSQNLLDTNQN